MLELHEGHFDILARDAESFQLSDDLITGKTCVQISIPTVVPKYMQDSGLERIENGLWTLIHAFQECYYNLTYLVSVRN